MYQQKHNSSRLFLAEIQGMCLLKQVKKVEFSYVKLYKTEILRYCFASVRGPKKFIMLKELPSRELILQN